MNNAFPKFTGTIPKFGMAEITGIRIARDHAYRNAVSLSLPSETKYPAVSSVNSDTN
jgi:hypothetical protein